jgi:hypothetical protein
MNGGRDRKQQGKQWGKGYATDTAKYQRLNNQTKYRHSKIPTQQNHVE